MKSNPFAEQLHFSQVLDGDPWTDLPYWNSTVRTDGCGMVSLAMCVSLLTGKTLTPLDVYEIRKKAGLDQSRVADAEGKSVCGGDVTLKLNPVNRRLFGVESEPLERTAYAFQEVLEQEKVIWASSRHTPFYDIYGRIRPRKEELGHVIVFWKVEKGVFYAKDCAYGADLGNNVPYTRPMLQQWLSANPFQQFALRKVQESRKTHFVSVHK